VAEKRLADLDQKITDLTRMRRALSRLVHTCHSGLTPECPILEALEK